ncbi:hypothetical protein BH11MYX2_BH11MYX2_35640 [soil metagenome]
MNREAVVPRESTISNTNGTGNAKAVEARASMPQGVTRDTADPSGPESSGSLDLDAATILQSADDDAGNEDAWNAKSYPTMHQPNARAPVRAESPVLQSVRPSALPLQAPSQTPPRGTPIARLDPNERSGRLALPQHGQTGPMQMPSGPNHMPAATHGGLPSANRFVPVGQFGTPGSGSGPSHPSHPALRIPTSPVTTRHGYASAASNATNDISYPRYEPGADGYTGENQLKPNRRPLFIGLGLAIVGLIVLLAITLAGGTDEKPVVIDHGEDTPPAVEPVQKMDQRAVPRSQVAPAPIPTEAQKPFIKAEAKPEIKAETPPETNVDTKVETRPATATPDRDPMTTAAPEPASPADTSIAIDIQSTPIGADVLLAGKPLGTTPLKTNVPRGTGSKMITVHKAGFVDNVKEIDLRDDFASEVTLKKVADEKATPKPTPKAATPSTVESTKPACQPPGQADPFDPRPPCKK